jgi:3-dehydroquinate dehydratase type I
MICTPVVAGKQTDALKAIQKSSKLVDVIELRMDLILDGNVKDLIAAVRASSGTVKVLVTNRSDNPSDCPAEKDRIGVLLEAVSLGADFVDLELKAAQRWREKLKAAIVKYRNRTKLIVSEHNFSKTPSLKSLLGTYNESVGAGAQIVKIVTLARKPEDNLRVLSIIPYARRRNMQIIAFCMGEQGKISRVAAPLLGSFFTFASLERGSESASGQLTIVEMKQLLEMLGERKS